MIFFKPWCAFLALWFFAVALPSLSWAGYLVESYGGGAFCPNLNGTYQCSPSYPNGTEWCKFVEKKCNSDIDNRPWSCNYWCDNASIVDSTFCLNFPSAEGCTDACTESKNECESQGGIFSGSAVTGKCIGSCNLCQSEISKLALERLGTLCCQAGVKPPKNPQCIITGVDTSGVNQFEYYEPSLQCDFSQWEQQKVCQAFTDSLDELSSSSSVPVSSSSVSEYCQIFPDDLACICADDSTRPECAYLRSSSSEGAPEGSSGSEGGEGSSGSGGGEGGEGSSGSGGGGAGGVGDWEYDYRDSLHKIINSTTRTAKNTQGITDSLGTIATLLRFARCLWDDCTNYDSLRAVFGSETGDSSDIQGIDLDTSGYLGGMEALRDSLAEYWGWGDSATLGDVGYGIDSGSVDSAYGAIREQIGSVFGEGGNNSAQSLGDSLKEILEDKFPTSSWGYTQSCPEVLRTPVSFNIVGIEVNTGVGLGRYFCSPLPTLGLTLGTIARAVIRLIITITMAFGIYKFAMTGGKGE